MSSNDIAIRVENLSKKYKLGLTHAGSLRELTERWFGRWKKSSPSVKPAVMPKTEDEFWALRDISFEVKRGEVLGIIGSNGAGKSTLLKILSQITKPTSGRAEIHGRVGSLLEVGTGFHPELTGHENIFLNGAILGMTRAEVRREFENIVAFAGVDRFIHTPVKRYSSGMKVRLGFAVAAHLNPEVLMIDEVLAVGDIEFQRRCLAKMNDVAASGRTVFFVSHNLPMIQRLCSRAVLFENGNLVADGDPESVLEEYLSGFAIAAGSRDLRSPDVERRGSGDVRFESVELQNLRHESTTSIPMGEGLRVLADVYARSDTASIACGIAIFDAKGQRVCGIHSGDTAGFLIDLSQNQRLTIACNLPDLNLMPGIYKLTLAIQSNKTREPVDQIENAVSFEVIECDIFGTGRIPRGDSIIYMRGEWSCADHEAHYSSALSK